MKNKRCKNDVLREDRPLPVVTAEREALCRIARIGAHRGMDGDEAVERLIASVGYARQALSWAEDDAR